MKIKLPPLATAIVIVSGAVWFNPQPAKADPSFYCGSDVDGTPTTMVRHPLHGDVPIIRWVSDHFSDSGYDPQTRCEMVSQRFQIFSNDGSLKYLTTGRMNRQPVVCVSLSEGGGCEGLLFTLKPTSNPSQTLQNLLARRASASSKPLNETGDRLYINFENYLEEAAQSEENPTETSEPSSDAGSTLW